MSNYFEICQKIKKSKKPKRIGVLLEELYDCEVPWAPPESLKAAVVALQSQLWQFATFQIKEYPGASKIKVTKLGAA